MTDKEKPDDEEIEFDDLDGNLDPDTKDTGFKDDEIDDTPAPVKPAAAAEVEYEVVDEDPEPEPDPEEPAAAEPVAADDDRVQQAVREAIANKDRELAQLRGQNDTLRDGQIAAAESNIKNELDAVRGQLAVAIEDGKSEEQAKLHQKMGETTARAAQLATFKQQHEARKKAPAQRGQPVPANALADKWKLDNPWFAKKGARRTYAVVIDKELTDEGLDQQTPEYFTELNRRMRSEFPDLRPKSPRRQQPRRASPVAPVSNAPSRGKGKVIIGAAERARMETFNLDPTSPTDLAAFAAELRKSA